MNLDSIRTVCSEIYGKEQIKVFLAFCQGVSTIHHYTTVAKIKKAMGQGPRAGPAGKARVYYSTIGRVSVAA